MKQITKITTLKQGDKKYYPIEIDSVIYWIDLTAPIEEVYPQIVVEKLNKMNTYCLFQIDNINDIDRGLQYKIIAQSQPKIEFVPIIRLDSYIESLAKYYTGEEMDRDDKRLFSILCSFGKQHIQKQYTYKDIEKIFNLAREIKEITANGVRGVTVKYETFEEAAEQLNSISIIEVDEQFNIIKYE